MTMNSQHTRLHWEVSALAEVAAESDSQHSHKLATCAEIEALAQKLWGDSVSVAHHGSTHSGASLRGSDLDLVLAGVRDLPKPDNPGGNGYLPQTREMVANYLDTLEKILTEETTLVSDLEIVRTARMPLLKAKLSGGIDLKVTLSPLDVKDIPACQTAELVSKTFKELPHARKLLLILKALMRPPNCLNAMVGVHTGGVSSYTITLMVLAFCKFQAAQLNVSNVDLGSLFLSFLQFYSEPSHFDVTRHAIDVVVTSGFAQKHEVQAHLDTGVRQQMADRLCALEPISRHDIGQNSYRIKQMFEVMAGLREHLASMNPYLSAGESDIEALRIMSSPRSYRTAVTPRQPEPASSSKKDDTSFTSTWVERYLPLLGTILDVASIIPVKQETSSPSGPPKAPPPQREFPPGAIFVPGYGAMTLGQVSMLSAQEAPLMGPHGSFGPDAFPTLQESVSVEANRRPTQPSGDHSSPRSSPPSPKVRAHVHTHGGHMHGGLPGHAMYGVYAPHLVSEHSFPGAGKKGGHGHGYGNNHGPLSRGHSTPSQYQHGGGPKRVGGGGGPHNKAYHNRNNSVGSSTNASFAKDQNFGPPPLASNTAERGKPTDFKAQPGGQRQRSGNRKSPNRKSSPISIDQQKPGMNRNGSAPHLRDVPSSSWRDGDRESAGAVRDGASESESKPNGARSCPLHSGGVAPEALRFAEGASPVEEGQGQAKPAGEKSFEKPFDKSFDRGAEAIDSSLGGCPESNDTAPTVSLSMRSKSVGTISSSAVSPMMLSLSPHGVPTVSTDAATTPQVEVMEPSARTPTEARISDSGSVGGAQQECKDKDSASSENASTPSAAAASSKRSGTLQQHREGEGRGDGRRGGTGFAPGGVSDKRFNNQSSNNNNNAPWGGRNGGRRFKGDRGGPRDGVVGDGGSAGRSYNPGGGTGAFQGHHHNFGQNNSGRGGAGRWGGPRNPQHQWNNYNGGSAQRGPMPPHGGPGGMHMVPVPLPVYPAYPSHSGNSPYNTVQPYYVMQNPQGHASSATNASDSSTQQSSAHPAAVGAYAAAAANGAKPQRQHSAAQPDDAAHAQSSPVATGATAGAAPPPSSQSQRGGRGGGKQQAAEPPQHPPQQPPTQPQPQAGGAPPMGPMMLVPNHGPPGQPGQGGSSGGAPQHGQSHSWPTPVLHPSAMMQQHPGGPSFMPQAVMYVALPAHMQMAPGAHSMQRNFSHPARGGGGGVQGWLPHRDHHTMPRNNNNGAKHRNGPRQGFDVPNSNGRGRGEGGFDGRGRGESGFDVPSGNGRGRGRGAWNDGGGGRGGFGRGGAGRDGGAVHRRSGSFGQHAGNAGRPIGGKWRGEQTQGLPTPEATQG